MLLSLLSKEIKEIHREKRLRLLLVSFGLILVVMLVSSFVQWREEQGLRQQAAVADRELWLGQDEKNPHDAAHYGMYVFRPASVLSILDPGVNEYVGTSLFLEAHRRNESQNAGILDESGLARFGNLSPRFLILSIFPLFLVLIGFDAFTREREGETLPILTANGLSPWVFAGGKWLSLITLCVVMLLPITLLSFGLAALAHDTQQLFQQLFFLLGVYLIFLIGFSALVLTVSLWSPSSRVSLVALLGIWFIMTVALPRLTTNLAEEQYPYPTHVQFQAEIAAKKAKGLDGHNPFNKAAKEFKAKTLADYGVEKLEDLPFNFSGLLAQRGEEYESSVYAEQYETVKNQYRQQMALFLRSAIFSPYLATRFASMALCRTDDPAFWHFSEAAEAYRIEFNRVLNMHNAENTRYGQRGYLASKDLWAEIPAFNYQPMSLADSLPRITPFLTTLSLQFLGCMILLFVSAFFRGRTRY